MQEKWKKTEIKFLYQNFSDFTDKELSKSLNRSIQSVTNKARKLKLKKSAEHKSKCISIRNKIVGRDLSMNLINEISKKYKTRSEFQKMDSSAYSAARKLGILDNVCSHMLPQNFSVPQLILKDILSQLFNIEPLYNSRRIIPPYEIDIYFPIYNLGFEYNGKGWHLNSDNDIIKAKICKEKKIQLVTIVENNRNYEIDIKNQLCSKIKLINKITHMSITESNIMLLNIHPYDNIIDINQINSTILKYVSLKEFINHEHKLYQKLVRLNMLELLSPLKKERHSYSDDEIIQEIEKYEYLLDFINNSHRFYIYIHKHNLKHLLLKLKRK